MSTAMIAMTTSSSMRVKAPRPRKRAVVMAGTPLHGNGHGTRITDNDARRRVALVSGVMPPASGLGYRMGGRGILRDAHPTPCSEDAPSHFGYDRLIVNVSFRTSSW